MILAYSSNREFDLGCYSLSLLVSGQIFGLANMLSLVMGPGGYCRARLRYYQIHRAVTDRRRP